MLPAGVRDCYATRSPVLGLAHDAQAFQLLGERYKLWMGVRLSQAAAGVGARPVPGAAARNYLSRGFSTLR